MDPGYQASRRASALGDVIESTGQDFFMSKNYKGETVKITCLLDAAKASGYEPIEEPTMIDQAANNFINTRYGKITCMSDVIDLFKKN